MTIQPRWYESNLMIGALLLVLGGLVLYTIFEDKSLRRSKAEQTILKLGGKLDQSSFLQKMTQGQSFKSYSNVEVPVGAKHKAWTQEEALAFASAVARLDNLRFLRLPGDALRPDFIRTISLQNQFRQPIHLLIVGPVDSACLSAKEISFPVNIGLSNGGATHEIVQQLFANPQVRGIGLTRFAFKDFSLPRQHAVQQFNLSVCDTSHLFTDEFLRDWSSIRYVSFLECQADAKDLIRIFQSNRPEGLQVEFEVSSSGKPLALAEVRKLYEQLAPWAYSKELLEQDAQALRLVTNPENYDAQLWIRSFGYLRGAGANTSDSDLHFELKLRTVPGIKLKTVEFEALSQLFSPDSKIELHGCKVAKE